MRFGSGVTVDEVFAPSADSHMLFRIHITDVASGLDACGATANNKDFVSALDLAGGFGEFQAALDPRGESLRVVLQKVRGRFAFVDFDGAITATGSNDQRVVVEGLRATLGCGDFNLVRGGVDTLEHRVLVGDVRIFTEIGAAGTGVDSFESAKAISKLVSGFFEVLWLDDGAEGFGDVFIVLRFVDDGDAVLRAGWVTSDKAAGNELAAI